MSNTEDDDFNIDHINEILEEEHDAPVEYTSNEEWTRGQEKPPVEPQEVKEEEKKEYKPDYSLYEQNNKLSEEIARLREDKQKAERIALESFIKGAENQLEGATSNIDRYSSELAAARDDGDTAKSIRLENKIREEYSRIENIKGQISEYRPMLENYQNSPSRQPEDKGRTLALSWARENQAWLNDPANKDKRAFAEAQLMEMQRTGDMGKLAFWSELDKKINSYNQPKQDRMPKNMVQFNNNATSPKKHGVDKDLVRKVAYILKEKAGHEEWLKDPAMMKSFLKHYKQPHEEGKLRLTY